MPQAGEFGRRGGGFVKPGFGSVQLSHALSFQFDAVRAVDQAVEHGAGDGRAADVLVPEFDRHLTGHDGGRPVLPVVDDLHQVAPLFARQGRNRPVV